MRTHYREGDYLAICDRCGHKRYASEMSLDWKNLFVCPGCFETRHPQDFVTGVEDDQSVPIARPAIAQSVGSTTVKVAAVRGDLTIDVNSITGIADKDPIGIVLDEGMGEQAVHWTYVNGTPAGDTVTLGTYMPRAASVDNMVYLPAINNETFQGPTDVVASEL